jgi:hypothetical protein
MPNDGVGSGNGTMSESQESRRRVFNGRVGDGIDMKLRI